MISSSAISSVAISGATGLGGGVLSIPSPLGAPAIVDELTVYSLSICPAPLGQPAIVDVPLAFVFGSIPGPLAAPDVVALAVPVMMASVRGPLSSPELWAVRPPSAIISVPGPLSAAPAMLSWHDWSASTTTGRRTTINVLEIVADGFDTIRIPISSYQSRLRSGDPSYLQVSIPDAPAWAAAVAERAEGQMILYGGIRIEETGAELLEEIARVDIGLIADQRGVRNQTISVSGHATLATGAARTRTLRGLSYRASSGTGKRYRCSPDVFLRPGDTAIISEYGESITVGLIVLVVGGSQSTMEVSEAAA